MRKLMAHFGFFFNGFFDRRRWHTLGLRGALITGTVIRRI